MKNIATTTTKFKPNPSSKGLGFFIGFNDKIYQIGRESMKATLIKISGFSTVTLFGFLLFLSPPVMASPDLQLSGTGTELSILGNVSISANPAQTGMLSVFLDNDQSTMDSLQFSVVYDPQVTTITSIGAGSAMSGCNTNPASEGNCNVLYNIPSACTTTPLPSTCTAYVGIYASAPLAQGPNQQIVVINYTALAAGNSTLTLGGYAVNPTTGAFVTPAPASPMWNESNLSALNSASFTVSATQGTPTPAWGKVLTGDTSVTYNDVVAVRRVQAGLTPPPDYIAANAYVDGGTSISYTDVVLISRYQAGAITQGQFLRFVS